MFFSIGLGCKGKKIGKRKQKEEKGKKAKAVKYVKADAKNIKEGGKKSVKWLH